MTKELFMIALIQFFSQDYPKEKLYVLLVDGGSTDNTLQIASNFGAKIISRPDLRDDPSTSPLSQRQLQKQIFL